MLCRVLKNKRINNPTENESMIYYIAFSKFFPFILFSSCLDLVLNECRSDKIKVLSTNLKVFYLYLWKNGQQQTEIRQ